MKLEILDPHGKVVSVLESISIAPVVGSTVTIKRDQFVIAEIAFNYDTDTISAYSNDYPAITEEQFERDFGASVYEYAKGMINDALRHKVQLDHRLAYYIKNAIIKVL